jgi:hypothetical protein
LQQLSDQVVCCMLCKKSNRVKVKPQQSYYPVPESNRALQHYQRADALPLRYQDFPNIDTHSTNPVHGLRKAVDLLLLATYEDYANII